MKISLTRELFVFVTMIFLGVLEGVLFDIFSVIRSFLKKHPFFMNFSDFMCWISAGTLFLAFTLFSTNGEIRFFMILGLGLGLLFYVLLLSKPVKRLIFRIFSIFFDFFQFILKILLTPAHFLYKIIIRYIVSYLVLYLDRVKGKVNLKNFRIKNLRIKNDKKKEQK